MRNVLTKVARADSASLAKIECHISAGSRSIPTSVVTDVTESSSTEAIALVLRAVCGRFSLNVVDASNSPVSSTLLRDGSFDRETSDTSWSPRDTIEERTAVSALTSSCVRRPMLCTGEGGALKFIRKYFAGQAYCVQSTGSCIVCDTRELGHCHQPSSLSLIATYSDQPRALANQQNRKPGKPCEGRSKCNFALC